MLVDFLESESNAPGFAGSNREAIMSSGLCPGVRRINSAGLPSHDKIMERVFDELASVRRSPKSLRVRFVVGEEQFGRAITIEPVLA